MLSSSEGERIPQEVADCLWTQTAISTLPWVSSQQANSADWNLPASTILWANSLKSINLSVSRSFWRRTLTDTVFMPIFLQRDYHFFFSSRNTYWIASHKVPIKQFFFTLTITPFNSSISFSCKKTYIHENPRYHPALTLFHIFFFAFSVSGGKWSLAVITDKIDIATLKTPTFWL